jgi:alpha-beta hydrolase superfamily lysophospholipase
MRDPLPLNPQPTPNEREPERSPEGAPISAPEPSRPLLDAASFPTQSRLARYLEVLNLRINPPGPEEEFYPSRQLYEDHVGPSILAAATYASPRLYISGLAATTYHWRDIHVRGHAAGGGYSEVRCLRGHDGGFFHMVDITVDDWVKDVETNALKIRDETGRLPILHGHSTGALVALVAATRFAATHPGDTLCNGLILSAPPFELRQALHRVGLVTVKLLHRFSTQAEFWRRLGASLDGGGLDPDIPGKEAPAARWLPVQMLLQLEKLRPIAAHAATKLEVPLLIIHGTNDVMANWKATASIYRKIPSVDRELVIVRGGRHSMMFGPHADEFSARIERWIDEHCAVFEARDERRLRAAMLGALRSRWNIPPPAQFKPLPPQSRRIWYKPWQRE